ncbi:type IV pilus modification protein PilV [Pseudomonas sp. X10]
MSVQQRGMTLIEVLVALVLLALGLFSAASLQVRALQATDSALRSSQVAYLAQGMFERVRARDGVVADELDGLQQRAVALVGESAEGRARVAHDGLDVDIRWSDSRAGDGLRSFSLQGRVRR